MHMRRGSFLAKLGLVALAALIGGALPAPAVAQSGNLHVKVMTRNMDAGTDLNYVAGITDPTAFTYGLMQTVAEVDGSHIPARAARLAAEIAENTPDLIALQEVTLWDITDQLGHRTYDQLALLQAALNAAGQHYRVAAVQQLTDIPVNIPGVLSARFTDHNAILVRCDLPPGDVAVGNVATGTYQAAISFASPLGAITVLNGWMAADVNAGGVRFKFVNTHLLSPVPGDAFVQTSQLQLLQGLELLRILRTTNLPVILAGDFNSDAEHAGIGPDQTLTAPLIAFAGYIDAWGLLRFWLPGFTWTLFPEDGSNYTLSERIDILYSRGAIPFIVQRTGLTPGPNGVFASDHAGVVATYALRK